MNWKRPKFSLYKYCQKRVLAMPLKGRNHKIIITRIVLGGISISKMAVKIGIKKVRTMEAMP